MNEEENKGKHLSEEDVKYYCKPLKSSDDEEKKLYQIEEEFRAGIDAMKKLGPSVSFYGGARFKEDHKVYKKVQHLANRIVKELNYNIITGGGGGVMEAASRGAYETQGNAIGLTIRLPKEQDTNKYVTQEIPFRFFFARQVSMSYTTEVCIFCPGGFGTMNELFEILTLEQTGKIGKIPIIFFDTEYWKPLEKVIEETFLKKYETIAPKDLNLYTITDDEDTVLEIIKSSKIRDGEDSLN